MKRFVPAFIAVLVGGAFIATLVFLFLKARGDDKPTATEKPTVADIVKKTVATGAVKPRKEIAIVPRVSGIVEKLHVSPGLAVDEGTLIAKIRIVPDVVRLNEAEARVREAEINAHNTKEQLDRYEQVKGVIAQTEFANRRLEAELADEKLEAARTNLQLVREGASRTSSQASTLVRSTVKGMVLEVPVEEGSSVIESNAFNAGTTIATVADMGDMLFIGFVDESEVGRLRDGMDLDIKVGAIADQHFAGKLERIAPKGVEKNGAIQFEIRAAMSHADGLFIRAGYSASADIVVDQRAQVLSLSERLLQFEGEKVFVEVQVDAEHFEKRYLEVGLSDGIRIEVRSGLAAGDLIKVPEA